VNRPVAKTQMSMVEVLTKVQSMSLCRQQPIAVQSWTRQIGLGKTSCRSLISVQGGCLTVIKQEMEQAYHDYILFL
jgi:hypothetical protein